MSDTKKYLDLKKQAEQLRTKRDQASGAAEQALKQLKRKFKVDDIDQAQDRLEALKKDLKKLESNFTRKNKAFVDKWGDHL